MNNSCGIYKITNKINNKCYIGQSIHIEQRWKEHIQGKGNKPLHQDIQQYGIENFSFEIIELCSSKLLDSKEKYWINYYNTDKIGYNQKDIGFNIYAVETTRKNIYCYDLEGNFIQKYNSLAEAERLSGIDNSNISRAAKTHGRTKQYQWSYIFYPKLSPYKRYMGNVGKNSTKAVIQYDLNMNKIQQYNSITEASQKTGINVSSISGVCHFKRKTAGGYIWRFLTNA